MKQEELSKLTDEELMKKFKSIKPSPLFDAFFIGFLIGIIIFGVVANAWGFLFVIPLFLIYLFLKKSNNFQALHQEIEKRKL